MHREPPTLSSPLPALSLLPDLPSQDFPQACHTSYPHKAAFHGTPSARGSGDAFRSSAQLLEDSTPFPAALLPLHRSSLILHRTAPPSSRRLSPYPQPVNNFHPVFSPDNPHSYPPHSQVFRGQLPYRFFSFYGSEPAHLKLPQTVLSSHTP